MTGEGRSQLGDRLTVIAADTADDAARAAAAGAAAQLRELLRRQPRVRVMLAAALSQEAFLGRLRAEAGIAWSRIDAFQLDEYVGLPIGHPASFGQWLRDRLYGAVGPGSVALLDCAAASAEAECARYSGVLAEVTIDVAFLGVGENGHLAFNDPAVADFDDPLMVKVVPLDSVSRHQQVHDGAFERVEQVPRQAMTVTIPRIFAARHVAVLVTGARKSAAVAAMLQGPVSRDCPASFLRRHPDARVYVDEAALSRLAARSPARQGGLLPLPRLSPESMAPGVPD